MIIHIKNNWASAETEHNAYVNNTIDKFLNKSIPVANLDFTHQFVKLTRLLLTSSNINEVKKSIELYNIAKAILSPKSFLILKADLKRIFKYSTFIAKTTKPWNAYNLCESSISRTCPYCNQTYSFTVTETKKGKKKQKTFRPTLDHFYPKDKYPHLALTLANLVPSCSTCNSTLKGDADFSEEPHLHPLYDDENIIFLCDTEKHTIVDIRSNFESLRPELKILIKPKVMCGKTKNSMETFAIVSRYKKVNSEALDFISAKSTLPRLFNEQLIDLESLKLEERVLRFKRSNYSDYLLGKMFADLYDQFHQ